MAGPGIPYRQFALQLADRFDVALVIPNEPEEELPGVRVLRARDHGYGRFKQLARSYDVVVAQQLSIGVMQLLTRSEIPVVYDLYDPILFEALGFYAGQKIRPNSARRLSEATFLKQILAPQTGSAFICASDRQRDFGSASSAPSARSTSTASKATRHWTSSLESSRSVSRLRSHGRPSPC
jgi:hypothetical protein